MKRKIEDNPLTMASEGKKPKKLYLGDPKLVARVREYIGDHINKKTLDVSGMAEHLQQQYRDYTRKKKNAFRKSVEKAYQVVRTQDGDDDFSLLEKQHLKKRQKKKESDVSDSEKSFSSDNEEYVFYEDRNSMNNFMSDLYLGTKSDKNTEPKWSSNSSVKDKSLNVCNEDKSIILEDEAEPNSTINKTKRKTKQIEDTPAKKKKKDKSDKKGPDIQTSTVKFADMGGNEETLKEVCKLLVHMRHPEVYQKLGVTPPQGFLLHGPPGCGKTLLANAIAGELGLPFIKLAATEVVSGVSGESEEKIRDLFDKAVVNAPCIVFIDEIDAITQKRETASKEMERRIVTQLLACMDELNSKKNVNVLVIGATNRPDSIDPALRRAGRFDREISLGIPDESARRRILEVLCRDLRLTPDFDFQQLARNSPGFVGADLMALAREAAMTAVHRVFKEVQSVLVADTCTILDTEDTSHIKDQELKTVLQWLKEQPPLTDAQLQDLYINMEDFQKALKNVQPSAKREGFATIPDVTWDDIGALKDVREELHLAIMAPVKHPEEFQALGLSSPPGILLAGPPGCGKTLLAKAIANESGINFISVKGPELLNMYVGESERAVRQVFQRGRNSSPCVIFFDEIDSLCPRRSGSTDGGSSVRVVNQMLTEMDGLETRKQVYIMAATNRPDIIDPAILRPGRLDKTLYVGLPSVTDRLDILTTLTKNGTRPCLADDVDLAVIAADEKCEGYTGADLAALVRESSVCALKQLIQSTSKSTPQVTNEHFQTALNRIKPSVSKKVSTKNMKQKGIPY
ncbi:hypothetical protein SNE40_009245 [Patella caerulea]|uniref:AAA+ ATPase domain-containing protein n=1 Tax=Patella caerulea TaxID=87958 RepID=A0AAN8JQP0_PATCE